MLDGPRGELKRLSKRLAKRSASASQGSLGALSVIDGAGFATLGGALSSRCDGRLVDIGADWFADFSIFVEMGMSALPAGLRWRWPGGGRIRICQHRALDHSNYCTADFEICEPMLVSFRAAQGWTQRIYDSESLPTEIVELSRLTLPDFLGVP
jgi:hypothetical protein